MTISFLQKINSNGGPRNFQLKFINWLKSNNIEYNFCDNFFEKKKIILVNAGTKKIIYLIFQKILGAKIIQRLDGLNNLHEIKNNKIKFKAFLSNLSMNLIRTNLADKIIYQSLFVKERWEKKFGRSNKKYKIIHNPYFDKTRFRKSYIKKFNILIMEGNIQNDIKTINLLKWIFLASKINVKIDNVYILGSTDSQIKKQFRNQKHIKFLGFVSRKKQINLMKKNKMIYFPIEFNASCPNSYIELIARGIPSCFIDGGSLSELSKFSSVKIKNNSTNISLVSAINIALNKICENYNLYTNLKFLVSKRYERNKIFNQYLDFIYLK